MNRRSFVGVLSSAPLAFAALAAAPHQQAGLTIRVGLHSDRTRIGSLSLYDSSGTRLAGPFPALGKADSTAAKNHGNSARNPLLPYGDTPSGSYAADRLLRTGIGTGYRDRSYGPNGAIRLIPTSGDAALAADRTGLLIHSGDPSSNGGLRPTNGCIRLSNADMASLVAAILVQQATAGPLQSCTVGPQVETVVGVVGNEDPAQVYDEGDPPPLSDSDPVLP